MIYVGLTGGIASGKSTVARRLTELGARIIDADILSREVVQPGKKAWAGIRKYFGPGVLRPDRTINRAALRDIIFKDPDARKALNRIVHPEVYRAMAEARQRHESADPSAVIVADVPLLFEADVPNRFDRVILVCVTPEIQMARLMSRDGVDRADARKALAAQMPLAEKKPLADYIIDNSGSIDESISQVDQLFTGLKSLAE